MSLRCGLACYFFGKLKKNATQEKRAKHQDKQILYHIIISMPDEDKVCNLEKKFDEVTKSNKVGEILKKYLRDQSESRYKWFVGKDSSFIN